MDHWRGPLKSFLYKKHGIKEYGCGTEWQEDLPLEEGPWWGVTTPDRCFVSRSAAWCAHCSGHFHWKAGEIPHHTQRKAWCATANVRLLPFQTRAYIKPDTKQEVIVTIKGYKQHLQVLLSHQSNGSATHFYVLFFVFHRFAGVFILKSFFNSQGYSGIFNQHKSLLSYKEKALKSYYDPQRPLLFLCNVNVTTEITIA